MKSHVTLEQHVCIVCSTPFDTGNILLDKQLRQRFEMHTITGHGVCDDCQEKADKGFMALVEVSQSPPEGVTTLAANNKLRTGRHAFIQEDAFDRIFKIPKPMNWMVFVEPGVLDILAQKVINTAEEDQAERLAVQITLNPDHPAGKVN